MKIHEDIKRKRSRIIRKDIRDNKGDYDKGDNTRIKSYNIPKRFEKRFKIFMKEVATNYYYTSMFSDTYGLIDTKYFSIKCNAFTSYITNLNIDTISDVKHFLDFLNSVIVYRPPLLNNWNKKDFEIHEENELTSKAVGKICNKYIRNSKIKKVLK
jgi:hypothetical protein